MIEEITQMKSELQLSRESSSQEVQEIVRFKDEQIARLKDQLGEEKDRLHGEIEEFKNQI